MDYYAKYHVSVSIARVPLFKYTLIYCVYCLLYFFEVYIFYLRFLAF